MNLSNEIIKDLEYNIILEHISSKCVSESGKARLLNSELFTDTEVIKHNLQEVTEVKEIFQIEGKLPVWSFQDMRATLYKIEPLQSYLDPIDCQGVQNVLQISYELQKFIKKQSDRYPALVQLTSKIDPLASLFKLIDSTIDPSGAIYDNASPDLKKIRNEIEYISKQIHIKLDRIKKKYAEYLQEEYITLRDGRLVLPVREFSVNKISGIVHGQSATGQTHYVEPMSVVQLNNQMNELYAQEKKEIIRILKRLADNIREHRDSILTNFEILIHFDVLQAKANYAISCNGIAPVVNSDFYWEIHEGYHPLLLKRIERKTIPISLKIGSDFRIMIISGPNAGGKTVALKTIGLLQAMFQSGFLIPVEESSKFPVCKNIFTVIGDEQSIENDLSTFSSHITKLNEIVRKSAPFSLILIDEIGTGTDPSEGSALAISILEKLNKKDSVSIVTTHHGDLKAFAHNTDGVINAAMQFDLDSLAPLYEIEVGIPGSSYAFDISRRLGVDEKILSRARKILGSSHHDLEDLISSISHIKQEYKQKLSEIVIKKSELDGLQSLYTAHTKDIKKKKNKYEKEALSEAQILLSKVNQTIEKVIREIRESAASPEIVKKGRKQVRDLSAEIEKKMNKNEEQGKISIADVSVGQTVSSKRYAVKGEISRIVKERNEIEIESNGVKIRVPVDDIIIKGENKSPGSGEEKKYYYPSASPVSNEIDLRGMAAEDAIIELEKYFDSVLESDWQKIHIIHGKGTGVLRKKIHEFLKKHKTIKNFRLGGYGEGDTGVTIIEF